MNRFPNLEEFVFETPMIQIPDDDLDDEEDLGVDNGFFFRVPNVERLTLHAGLYTDCDLEESRQHWKHLTIVFEGLDDNNMNGFSLETTKELRAVG